MNIEKPDISALTKAIDRLQVGLARYQLDITDTQIREGLIKRHEFTYDEEAALEVAAQIPAFLKEAIYCRDQLKHRLQ